MSYNNPNMAIITAITEQGMSVTAAARRFHRSRQWIYTLLKRYYAGGEQAVQPQPKTPRTSPNRIPPELVNQIIAIRQELAAKGADNGPDSIAWVLHQRGLRTPAESTIRRILTNHGLITPPPHKRPKSSYRRFEAALPNEYWQADFTHVRLARGIDVEVLDFLDDHSRYLLHISAHRHVTGRIVVDAMHATTSTFGLPQSTLTDNGLVFTARLAGAKGGKNGFEKFLEAHSIHQKNGRVSHPQTQGKIERFHQTLKRWLAARSPAHTIGELQHLLDEFQHWYNTQRPHRALDRRTPIQAYNDLPKASPQPLVTEDNRVRTDTVDKSGRITLRFAGQMRYLGIGRAHIGTATITVVSGTHATTSNAATGEIIAEHDIDTNRRYQPNLVENTPPRHTNKDLN